MNELGFAVVPMDVARNPVGRAVARRRMDVTVRDFCTRIYLLHDGEYVAADLMTAAHVLAVAVRVCEQRGERDSVPLRVMAGGMGSIAQCSARAWRWRELDAPAIDVALGHALRILRNATAQETRAAWGYVEQQGRPA
jgi:hypothetical protein